MNPTLATPSAVQTFPLSPAQLGFWYAQQLDPAVPLTEAQYIEMRGPLEVAALIRAARQAGVEFGCGILRLRETAGGPVQDIDPAIEPEVGYLDLSDRPDPFAAAQEWMRADVAAPMDLAVGAPGVSTIIRLGTDRHLWYSRLHHILIDGFGAMTMVRRIVQLYNAELGGPAAPPSAAAPLRELYDAELAYRASGRYTADEQYWREHTAGMPQRCSLVAADAPAVALAREERYELDPATTDALDAAGRLYGTGSASVVMAAVALYYARLTAQPEVVLNLAVSGRTTAVLRRSGGMMANIVPLRIRVPAGATLADLLGAVRQAASGALRHQRFRYEDMTGPQPDHAGTEPEFGRGIVGPVLNIMTFGDEIELTGIESRLHVVTSGPIEDLFVNFYQHGASAPIHLDFAANPRLYDQDSLSRHHARFLVLLESMLRATPETPVSDLEHRLPDEDSIAGPIHGPRAPAPRLLPDLLAAGRALAGDDAIAVVEGDLRLTYRELDERSQRLAHTLAAAGAGPETAVLVALPRSTAAMVALWAVAKTGAAHVPVGTGTPAERLTRIAATSASVLGVTDAGLTGVLPPVVRWLGITGEGQPRPGGDGSVTAEARAVPGEANPEDRTDWRADPTAPDHVAYIVFTSGSTGVPKGVAVTHRGLAALTDAVGTAYRPSVGSRVLQCLNPSFDAAVLEWLSAFGHGATLVVAQGDPVVGRALAAQIKEHGVTHLCSTPAVLATLGPAALAGVRSVSTGGDTCPPDLVSRFGIGRTLLNSYGPSEATVAATFTGALVPGRPAHLGDPVPGMGLVVLDRLLSPVTASSAGELYILGAGLARGYAGRPGATAERFVASPYGPPGSRMYRTGDVVRWTPDGRTGQVAAPGWGLEYVGRSDFQVKLHGVRVELGEVDAVLAQHPGVEIAVTVVRQAAAGSVLAAYVVPVATVTVTEAALLDHLARQLPPAAVPATVTVLSALPLTVNGKIDRTALPEPETGRRDRPADTVAERVLCGVFAQVLGLTEIGVDTSFFALGGDSVGAIALVAKARAVGYAFSARDVFEQRTPARLAAIATTPEPVAALPEGPLVELPPDEFADWTEHFGKIEDVRPVTPLQRGLWFQSRLTAGAPDHYVVQAVLDLEGELDPARLAAAASALVARHDVLRTAFVASGESVVQLVVEDVAVPWRTVHRTGEHPDEELDRLAAAELRAPFAVDAPPLIRFLCIVRGDNRFRLVITNHHLILDGWSMPLLFAELIALYGSRDWDSLPAPVSFRAFLHRQSAVDGDAGRAAWAEALRGLAGPTLAVPGAARGAVTAGTRELEVPLPQAISQQLPVFAADYELTLNTIVQVAWALVLADLTGSADVVFGGTVSGRPADLPGAERMVGMLINTIPVRIRLDAGEPVSDLLARVQQEQSALSDFHSVGLDEIQAVTGFGPLFDTTTVYESAPTDAEALTAALGRGGMTVAKALWRNGTHYPLALAGYAGPRLVVSHAAPQVDAETAERVVRRLVTVLTGMVTDPACRTARLLAADPAPGDARWAGPAAEPVRSLAELLTEHSDSTAAALLDGDTELTYAELDRRSNRLAHKLIERGAGPDTTVVVALPRSAEWFVAATAVAKSGAAFVPVDITAPAARIAAVATESGARLGVTLATVRNGLPDSLSWLDVDELFETGSAAPVTDADRIRPLRPEHAAYVVFTSGSTGTPKGVVVTHGGLANLAADTADRLGLRPGARVVHCQNPAFDAGILVWLGTLVAGGTLVIAPQGVNAGAELGAILTGHGATHLISTPSVLGTLDDRALAGLESACVGGEACPPALVQRVAADRALINSYGPAETTVAVTFGEPPSPGSPLPLGTPGRGVRLAVLDRWLRPVRSGATGELYVGGPGVARGYAGRAGLSAQRFVADPFTPGQRLYRTGDLVRWRVGPDAAPALEYLGRSDSQVKVRGVRVEPEEIDAVLTAHPGVAAAVTVPRTVGGAVALCSYVVSVDGTGPAQLQAWAAEHLPRYLIPGVIQLVPALPRTANGKVDVRALPEPELGVADYVPPNGTAAVVAAVFGEVLHRDRIGAPDEFFALGGDSLSATRVAARLGSALDTEVPVRMLFETPVVADLAAALDRLAGRGSGPELRPGPRPDPVPMSPAQQRMWFVNRYEPQSPAYNLPAVMWLRGDLDVAALRAALGDVVARHETLRTRYPEHDGVGCQEVLDPAEVLPALEPVPVTAEELEAAVTEVVCTGFDVTTEVPVRVRLFRLPTGEHVLASATHHIGTDGFSMGPLARDVAVAYAARRAGQQPVFPPLPVQYADYAVWQHARLGPDGEADSLLAEQLRYWKHTLADLPDHLELPVDRPRPARATHDAADVTIRIEPEIVTRVGDLAHHQQATPFMVLHAALAVLLARTGGGSDIALGTPVAGRGHPDLDDVVGMFVNTLVLRTGIRADESFRSLLRRVRRTDLDAFANADLPFERLVEVLAPTRSVARHPLVQVMLIFQNLAPVQVTLPGVTVEALQFSQTTSRFDLHLTVQVEDGGWSVRIGYATDLFDEPTVRTLGRRLRRLLAAVVADDSMPVGDIEILDAAERAELLTRNTLPAAPPVLLADVLATAVASNPDGTAIVCGSDRLTYRELDERSSRLAQSLVRAGAGPETLVAVAIPRSLESVLAVWAVTRSGAAFVPVDPGYPAERIERILAVSGAGLGLTTTAVRERFPDTVRWIEIDAAAPDGAPGVLPALAPGHLGGSADPGRVARVDNPAYVLFTSGSTGEPKGVVVTHAGLANLAVAQRERDPITARSRVLHVASPSFDASVLEMLMAVGAGACLVVAPADVVAGEDLTELMVRERVTHIACTPSVLATLEVGRLDAVEVVVTGGEPCPPDLVAAWDTPGRRYFNDYGPTESTVWAAGSEPLRTGDPITIGTAAPGMRARILDARMRLVPEGMVGELYLSGIGLARGYFRRPATTTGSFVADPYGAPGQRMYRTGDLARLRDGRIEYVGRTDHQVKLRGLRIELGDIEAALLADPAIAHAVAVVRDDGHGARLVAYVVAAAGELAVGAVKQDLAQRLPAYMVPGAIIELPALPRTANGKLDRAALPVPEPVAQQAYRAPTTDLERAVAAAFESVLGIGRVGADDNFFDLGGTSMVAIRLVSTVKAATGMALPVHWMFSDPTPAALAARLSELRDQPGLDPALRVLLPLRTDGDRTPVFCVHPAIGLAWCYTGFGQYLPGHPVYGLQSPGIADGGSPGRTVTELAVRYAAEIRRVRPHGPYVLLGYSAGGPIAQAVAVELRRQGEAVPALVMLDSRAGGGAVDVDESDMPTAADLLAEFGGVEVPEGEDVGYERAAELLAQGGGLFGALGASDLEHLYRDFRNLAGASTRHQPELFDGPLLMIRSNDTSDDDLAAGWGPYIGGAVTQYRVDFDHNHLTTPDALRSIGPVLAQYLDAGAGSVVVE
ncbi:non-ribosomal peptide synthetase [Nocardia stercoris]|nr:non-ribosomal peptide synthetase [Nocardia stercoris]